MSNKKPLSRESLTLVLAENNKRIKKYIKQQIDDISVMPQDTPVGSIITYMGKVAPAHYLVCDGSEYNIDDYPYLVQYFQDNFGFIEFFGGDGVTTFAIPSYDIEYVPYSIPVMQSHSQDGYVVSASSEYNMSYPAWQAFREGITGATGGWVSNAGYINDQWIMIDCGKKQICNKVLMCPRNYDAPTTGPKIFIIQGSNDEIVFDNILTVEIN